MLDRRGFLKFIGGAAVGTLATPVVWKGLDDISIWSQNWPWIPSLQYGNHENTYVRTVSKLCPAAGATKIRLVGGRPVRVLSDPESPLGGGVSALAVTEVQMRYSPARLKRPLLRNSDGGYREISWEEAEKLLLEKLAVAKKQTEHDSVVCISGDENGTMNELLAGFAAQTGSGRFFAMPSDAQATAQAWKLMGGRGRVGFDIPNSDYVFAVGANVLETWARWSSTATRGDRHVPRAPNPPCVWPMPGRAEQHGRGRRSLAAHQARHGTVPAPRRRPPSSSRTAWPPPPEGWDDFAALSPNGPRKKSAKSRASCPNVSPPSSTGSKRPRSLSWSSVPTWIRAAAPPCPHRHGDQHAPRPREQGRRDAHDSAGSPGGQRRGVLRCAHAGRSRPLRRRHGSGEHARSGRAHGL